MLAQILFHGLVTGLMYAVIALGFALIYNTTRILHIAYSALIVAGPYFLILFHTHLHVPLVPSMIFAILLSILLHVLINAGTFAVLERRKVSSNTMLITSLGLMVIMINVFLFIIL